ncbi:MAG TPA: LLM class flavin-dependent oxidoreductase, partial [Dehalococcoidia bacterium]|nr:LLM class flavin-dependent oxidoreductase [Dehalococcoidia bacterium]
MATWSRQTNPVSACRLTRRCFRLGDAPIHTGRAEIEKGIIMAVKIGIHGGQQDIEMDELRRMWRFADSNGFDFISLWDHFYEAPPIDGDSPVFEAIAGMAALAAETENARIGCHVLCVTYRNPGLLANSIMTIDHISHGRVEVGLGAGWQVPEHMAYGYPFDSPKARSDRLEEGIEALR